MSYTIFNSRVIYNGRISAQYLLAPDAQETGLIYVRYLAPHCSFKSLLLWIVIWMLIHQSWDSQVAVLQPSLRESDKEGSIHLVRLHVNILCSIALAR